MFDAKGRNWLLRSEMLYEKTLDILDYWNKKGELFNRHSPNAKYTKEGLLHCSQVLKKYDSIEIMNSIDTYYEILESEKTFAKVGTRGCFTSGFTDFFNFTYSTRKNLPKSGKLSTILPEGFTSWFKLCLNEDAIEHFYTKGWKKFHVLTDEEKGISNYIEKKFIGEKRIDVGRVTEEDRQNFIISARKLIKTINKWKDKIGHTVRYFSGYVDLMFEVLMDREPDPKKLESWHLSTDNLFKYYLPKWFKRKGLYYDGF